MAKARKAVNIYRIICIFMTVCFAASLARVAADPKQATLTIHTDKVANPISPFIYGHFFEHIYNGGDNGLWGEMVWNRSFEYLGDDAGWWKVKDGVITETGMAQGARLPFGDSTWTDYEFSVKARKLSGNEGFLIIIRGSDDSWFWVNLGGWNNTGHQLLHVNPNAEIGQRIPGSIETNRWYDIRVRVEGRHIQSFLDGKPILDDTLDEESNECHVRRSSGKSPPGSPPLNLKISKSPTSPAKSSINKPPTSLKIPPALASTGTSSAPAMFVSSTRTPTTTNMPSKSKTPPAKPASAKAKCASRKAKPTKARFS